MEFEFFANLLRSYIKGTIIKCDSYGDDNDDDNHENKNNNYSTLPS